MPAVSGDAPYDPEASERNCSELANANRLRLEEKIWFNNFTVETANYGDVPISNNLAENAI